MDHNIPRITHPWQKVSVLCPWWNFPKPVCGCTTPYSSPPMPVYGSFHRSLPTPTPTLAGMTYSDVCVPALAGSAKDSVSLFSTD